jgi:hypothetical protein
VALVEQKLPNTFVLGGQKCGSTWLAARLGQHPSVFMAPKEIHFFDKDYNYSKGVSWYARFFAGVTTQSIVAEKTPEYLWANGRGGDGVHSHSADVHLRIRSHFPDARFIVVMRDPVRRALSAVNHIRSYGYVPPSYSTESMLFGRRREIGSAFGVLEKGIYVDMLEAYFDLFERRNFLLFGFEEAICKNPQETMKESFSFLGLETVHVAHLEERENQVRASIAGMWLRYCLPGFKRAAHLLDAHLPAFRAESSSSLVDRLTEFYGPHNERLFRALGVRFANWSSS